MILIQIQLPIVSCFSNIQGNQCLVLRPLIRISNPLNGRCLQGFTIFPKSSCNLGNGIIMSLRDVRHEYQGNITWSEIFYGLFQYEHSFPLIKRLWKSYLTAFKGKNSCDLFHTVVNVKLLMSPLEKQNSKIQRYIVNTSIQKKSLKIIWERKGRNQSVTACCLEIANKMAYLQIHLTLHIIVTGQWKRASLQQSDYIPSLQ